MLADKLTISHLMPILQGEFLENKLRNGFLICIGMCCSLSSRSAASQMNESRFTSCQLFLDLVYRSTIGISIGIFANASSHIMCRSVAFFKQIFSTVPWWYSAQNTRPVEPHAPGRAALASRATIQRRQRRQGRRTIQVRIFFRSVYSQLPMLKLFCIVLHFFLPLFVWLAVCTRTSFWVR